MTGNIQGGVVGDTLISTTKGLIPIKEIAYSKENYLVHTHLGPKRILNKHFATTDNTVSITSSDFHHLIGKLDQELSTLNGSNIVLKKISDLVLEEKYNTNLLLLTHIDNIKAAFKKNTAEENQAFSLGILYSERSTLNDKIIEFDKEFIADDKIGRISSEIHDNILRLPLNEQAAFIAGIIKRVGVLHENGTDLKLTSYELNYLRQIQSMMLVMGLLSKITHEVNEKGITLYKLQIFTNFDEYSFSKILGIYLNTRMANKDILEVLEYSEIPAIAMTCEINMFSFANFGPQVIYCLEVEDVNMFSANGFYVSSGYKKI